MTAPILTEEQIREAAVDRYRSDAYCREGREDGFIAGARFALAAAAEREKLWREYTNLVSSVLLGGETGEARTRRKELRLALGIDKEGA